MRREALAAAQELEPGFVSGLDAHARFCTLAHVATILLAGVDLFFRGKLDGLLPGHRLVTTDTVETPELVIADIARIEPDEVADAYPDIPIVGFTNHTDTAGLRARTRRDSTRCWRNRRSWSVSRDLIDELVAS